MESDIALALMQKARSVYETESTYLSFPVSPVAFTEDELRFFEDSDDDQTGKKALNSSAEFSRLVNLIPSGLTFPPDDERFLWDVYNNVLQQSQVALSERTAEEEDSLRNVRQFLYDEKEEGLRGPSKTYAKYLEFFDANVLLSEKFNAEKIDAELTDSVEEKQEWTKVKLPEWKKRFKALDDEWQSKGSKLKVEQALNREKALLSKEPLRTWNEWRSSFDIKIDMDKTIAQLPFVPTQYLPFNATREGSWTQWRMTRSVAKQLIEQAPEELRKKLEGQARAVNNLKELRFEYSTAKIERFWFASDLFTARFFKYPRLLSTGDAGAQGECPSYVAGVVFAKNIRVETNEEPKPAAPGLLKAQGMTLFSAQFLNQEKASKFQTTQLQTKRIAPVFMPKATMVATSTSRNRRKRATAVRSARAAAQPRVRVASRPVVQSQRAVAFKRLQADNFPFMKATLATTIVQPRRPAEPAEPAKEKETEHSSAPVDPIYILALICKRVPKSPDPDPTFQWDF